jgi:flagellar basal-body rod modification protein FlgD
MQVNSTSSINTGLQTSTDTTSTSTQTLTQADFLKLLVAQMTSQDPLNPTSSQDLLTQTVQLSTLQSNTSYSLNQVISISTASASQ